MPKTEMLRTGIVCSDPKRLAARLLVSDITVLPPDIAAQKGYLAQEVIVPTEPRNPTPAELQAFVAQESTPHPFTLASLPRKVGEAIVQICQEPGFKNDPNRSRDLGLGFTGAPTGYRLDPPGMLNVSRDGKILVGDHIDCWDDPALRLAVINMGPGVRWHRITPGFSRDDIEAPYPVPNARYEHYKRLLSGENPLDLLAYWVKLNPPSETHVEGIVASPVARYLHDGATYGTTTESTAAFFAASSAMPPPVESII